jgi:transcriptional regulator with XRE-family HTH domain
MVNFVYMDTKERIVKLVRTYRQLKGLTQAGLAAKVGLPQQRINEIEAGNYVPTLKKLENIAKVLGIPSEKILNMKPIGDETFEKFCDELNNAPELYEFISYYSANKKKFKNFNLIEVFEELSKTPENKRRKLTKELRKLRHMIED